MKNKLLPLPRLFIISLYKDPQLPMQLFPLYSNKSHCEIKSQLSLLPMVLCLTSPGACKLVSSDIVNLFLFHKSPTACSVSSSLKHKINSTTVCGQSVWRVCPSSLWDWVICANKPNTAWDYLVVEEKHPRTTVVPKPGTFLPASVLNFNHMTGPWGLTRCQ